MSARKEATTPSGPNQSSIVFALGAPIARADIPRLCDALRRLLEDNGDEVVVCDVHAVVHPDAVTVDALARLQLTARRLGRRIRLRNASPELRELIDFTGLRAPMSIRVDVRPDLTTSAIRRGGRAGRRAERAAPCRGRT